MATRKVNLPPGFELDPTENLPPGFEIDSPSGISANGYKSTVSKLQSKGTGPSIDEFAGNALRDYGNTASGLMELGAQMPGPLAAMKLAGGENPNDPMRLQAMGAGMVQGIKGYPKELLNTVSHPIKSFYEKPLTTALDLSQFAPLAGKTANLARRAVGAVGERAAPGVLRVTSGIPEMATEMALKKPAILSQIPVAEEALNKVVGEPIVEAIKQAKTNVGRVVRNAFRKYAGMEGPMQEIIDTPIAQKITPIKSDVPIAQKIIPVDTPRDMISGNMTDRKFVPGDMITEEKVTGYRPGKLTTVSRTTHSYDDLLINKNLADEAFGKGDSQAMGKLYKEYVGTPQSDPSELKITGKDRLQILTRLKREVQQQAEYNKAPVTLKPIDSAKDAAFKKMASELDDMRGQLPDGKKLAVADDAWREINNIYDTVQRDLSDPGKAKDTMMRLLRGDNTWLTSGRMKGKVDVIRRAEQISGRKILEPALEELTRQVFNQWAGKGFVSQVLRGGSLALGGASFANPTLAPVAAASILSSSPRVIRGGLKMFSTAGEKIASVSPSMATLAAGAGAPLAINIASTLRRKK